MKTYSPGDDPDYNDERETVEDETERSRLDDDQEDALIAHHERYEDEDKYHGE